MKKTTLFVLFLVFGLNNGFSQTLTIDNAIGNAVKDIRQGVPRGTRIAVININTEFTGVADYVVNELIVQLVKAHLFQVLPRSEIELKVAQTELNFQYSGEVSDASAKSLGKFLGAGTIITGSFSQDSRNSYRLIVHAIDVESFTYQSSFRESIQNDAKTKQLVAGSGKEVYEDYTVGERLGTGAINIFFGTGSALQGDRRWPITAVVEGLGAACLIGGLLLPEITSEKERKADAGAFDFDKSLKSGLTTGGIVVIGAGIVIGFVTPFFYHKPRNDRVSLYDPRNWNIELISNETDPIAGLKIAYKLRF